MNLTKRSHSSGCAMAAASATQTPPKGIQSLIRGLSFTGRSRPALQELLPHHQSIEGPAAGRTTTLTTHPDTARTTITTTTSTHATTSATTSATTTSRQGSMLDTTWLQRHKPLPYQHTLPYASPRTPHHAAHPGGYSGHWGSQPASTITYSLSPADSWAEEECLVEVELHLLRDSSPGCDHADRGASPCSPSRGLLPCKEAGTAGETPQEQEEEEDLQDPCTWRLLCPSDRASAALLAHPMVRNMSEQLASRHDMLQGYRQEVAALRAQLRLATAKADSLTDHSARLKGLLAEQDLQLWEYERSAREREGVVLVHVAVQTEAAEEVHVAVQTEAAEAAEAGQEHVEEVSAAEPARAAVQCEEVAAQSGAAAVQCHDAAEQHDRAAVQSGDAASAAVQSSAGAVQGGGVAAQSAAAVQSADAVVPSSDAAVVGEGAARLQQELADDEWGSESDSPLKTAGASVL